MSTIKIEFDDIEVRQAVASLVTRMNDASPAMEEISALLVAGIEEAFDNQADPETGTPWERLSLTTIYRRIDTGHWPGKMLQVSVRLASSFVPAHGPNFALAGTNVVYATTMHYGAQRGQFGATKHGAPIPWGDIPARRFAGFNPALEADVLDIVSGYLLPN